MDFQKFYMGDVYDAYKYLGAHVEEDGVVFMAGRADGGSGPRAVL